MSEWIVFEWDLAHPVREYFKEQQRELNHFDLKNQQENADRIGLRELGRAVERGLPVKDRQYSDEYLKKLEAVDFGEIRKQQADYQPHAHVEYAKAHGKRAPADFLWAELRIQFGDGHVPEKVGDEIAGDPLLQQRIIDAVKPPFESAAVEIAALLQTYDQEMDLRHREISASAHKAIAAQQAQALLRRALPGYRDELATKIREVVAKAAETATRQLVAMPENLAAEEEKRGSTVWMIVKLTLGAVGIGLCVASAVLSWGVAGGLLAGIAIVSGARSFLDWLKGLRDACISAKGVKKRLDAAQKCLHGHFKTRDKIKDCAKAFLNPTFKVHTLIGYSLLGKGSFASLADLADDAELYEKKLAKIRTEAHEASRRIPDMIEKIGKQGNARTRALPDRTRVEFAPHAKLDTPEQREKLSRSKLELSLHKLLEETIQLHKDCDDELKRVGAFRAAVRETVQQHGEAYIQFEKWWDLFQNVELTAMGLGGGIAGWSGFSGGAKNCFEDTATIAGTVLDAISETDQTAGTATSKFES